MASINGTRGEKSTVAKELFGNAVEVIDEEENFPEHDAFEGAHFEEGNTGYQEVPTHALDVEGLREGTDGFEGGDVDTDALEDGDENPDELDDVVEVNNAMEGEEEEYSALLDGDDEYHDGLVEEYTNSLDDLSGMLDGHGDSTVDHNISDVEEEVEDGTYKDSPEM